MTYYKKQMSREVLLKSVDGSDNYSIASFQCSKRRNGELVYTLLWDSWAGKGQEITRADDDWTEITRAEAAQILGY